MNAKRILIITASDPACMGAWPSGYETVCASGDEAAIELAQQQAFAAIVIDTSDAALHQRKLDAILPILQPDTPLFRYRTGARTPVPAAVQEHFRQERNARIRRYLVLDDLEPYNGPELPAFSAN
ncbi:hypothetical protein EPD60_12945 [Flaviaesturariibacter flavus]|uniref:Response regulator n=1 Tax=Flaviaesturariibacter flavus TaxID=2502780 RepID=A0A4R1B975_9BACT|nr:hypothetical protein [Flaviaesturariibacter flavus]TCJ13293.1 hypothetical protein EPD60_12945 [Flaviaesturariibacter flavus]